MYSKGTDLTDIISDISTVATQVIIVKNLVNNLEAERLKRAVLYVTQLDGEAAGLTDIVNISDKGILSFIFQKITYGSTGDNTSLKIIVDGVTKLDVSNQNEVLSGFRQARQSGMLMFNYPFETSLQVQYAKTGGTPVSNSFVVYTTD